MVPRSMCKNDKEYLEMLRDHFAAKAMAAMIGTAAAPCLIGTGCESQTAQAAYEMADAMLKERAK